MTAPRTPGARIATPAVCLLGAAGDTGNLGVTALLHSTLAGLAARVADLDVIVFDNGWGVRPAQATLGGTRVEYRLCGLRLSRRLHRRESLANVRVSSWLGGLGSPAARAITTATAVLDLSGGDSFTDLYGRRRYRMITTPKRLVLSRGRRLVLLPQTYGPFSSRRRRRAAARIVRRATAAWARDARSYRRLVELAGEAHDPDRQRDGVDVAFGLPASEPAGDLEPRLQQWLAPARDAPVAGINVSGLLANDPGAPRRFGLRVDYLPLVRESVGRLLDEQGANVVLVPHVVGGGAESDDRAVAAVRDSLRPEQAARVAVAPAGLSPGEVKWLVGHLDWFCGTRMHSTIAALSSGVPAAALAYSLKTAGVFETCGMSEDVIDARELDDRSALEGLLASWRRRDAARARLAGSLPAVHERASAQMDAIAAVVTAPAAAAGRQGLERAGWSG